MIQSPAIHRRALHRIPEIGFELSKTLAYVRSVLEPLNCTLSSPIPGSLCAFFDCGKEETTAFRADMDALPISEKNNTDYVSTHEGKMHACGHDAHTAMLLSLASFISEHIPELPRNALLIFQPAEETSGGAKPLCDTGLLERYRVTRLFGLHLWPNLPGGKIFTCPGPMMAQANEITVTFTGKSVHISRHAEGIDSMTAAAEFLTAAYASIETLPFSTPRTLRFGKMISGTARNIVSGSSVLDGSLRTYDDSTFHACCKALEALAASIEADSGCTVKVHVNDGFPAVWNNERLFEHLCTALGDDAPALLSSPSLAGEDFSFYQKRVPALFFFLGVGRSPELHTSNFDFDDEAVLPAGVDFLKKLLFLD